MDFSTSLIDKTVIQVKEENAHVAETGPAPTYIVWTIAM